MEGLGRSSTRGQEDEPAELTARYLSRNRGIPTRLTAPGYIALLGKGMGMTFPCMCVIFVTRTRSLHT